MIGLYYTGATEYLAEQRAPQLSIGGFISNSLVPNGSPNNLFSDVSELSLAANVSVARGLAMLNQTGSDITNLRLWFTYPPDAQLLLEVAVTTVAEDECNHFFMERLPNENACPYVGNFVEADGEANAVVIGNLANSTYLGIWIKAKVAAPSRSCDLLLENFDNEVILPKQEEIGLVLDWT